MSNIAKNSYNASLIEEDREEDSYEYALQIVESMTLPMVMHAIIELDVLMIISKAGPGCKLLASEIMEASMKKMENPMAESMLDRMLWLLATYKIVTCSVVESEDGGIKRKYGLAPVAKFFIPNGDGVSLAPLMSLNQHKVYFDCWTKLKEAVLQGGMPFNMAHGMQTFEYTSVDPRFNEAFNKAMHDQTTYIMKAILRNYEGFTNIQQLVDVGGGLGHTLRIIISQYPNLKAINFDLPHVIEHAPPSIGIKQVSGDMFEIVPKGDAIIMKWILHDWNDDCCVTLLKNCYKALPDDGKVIVIESIIAYDKSEMTSNAARAISLLDISMMTQTPEGKERTTTEFEALANAAGFTHVKFVCNVLNFWVIEVRK